MGRYQWTATLMGQKTFCGKTRLCLIYADALACSIRRCVHTHTNCCLPLRPLQPKCLFPHGVNVNMQTLGKVPAFEIRLLCFPSKRFIFVGPLTAPARAPTPATDSKFHQAAGCNYPSCCFGGKAFSCQGLLVPQLLRPPIPIAAGVPAGTPATQPPPWPRMPHATCLCSEPTSMPSKTGSSGPGPALPLLRWGM